MRAIKEQVKMKKFFRAIVFLAMGLLLITCGQSVTVIPSPIPSPTNAIIELPTATVTPKMTTTLESTPTQAYVPPTLLPTIDPNLVPNLLRESISSQTLKGANGHSLQRITGWDYGFRQQPCSGYQWLDSNHLLLYPRTGQGNDGFQEVDKTL